MRNKYYYYTSSCIMRNTFSLYIFLLKRNKYCYYTPSCIMRNTLSCIREINIVIIHLLVKEK